MQEGTPLHSSKNRCVGISIPTFPNSPIAICNTYEDGSPIATTLGWELDDKKVFILDTKTRYPKTPQEVNAPRAFYLIIYKNNELIGIHKTGEVSSLSEIVEECENCDTVFWRRTYEYSTVQDGIIYNCTTKIPMSEDCPKHLPWAVFRELHLEVEMEPVGDVLEKIYSIHDSEKEIAITTAGVFKRVSGPRYQRVNSQYLHSGKGFHFSWVPAEKMIVVVTNSNYCETYHVDRVEEFATTPLTKILAKVVRKLYISVGVSAYNRHRSHHHGRSRQMQRRANRTSSTSISPVTKTTASMREAFELGWCLRGTQHWMSKTAVVEKSFADAGLDFRQYSSWQQVPYTVLDHVVHFPLMQVKKMVKNDSYSERLFCQKQNKENNYLAIGRAIVKHS